VVFRNNNSHSTAGLRLKCMQSFSIGNVTIGLTRKYARRARDYNKRAYRWGSMGLEVKEDKKVYKCHRSAFGLCRKLVTAAEVFTGADI
jgi:hypothetical protein